jgi:hypothetical protein
MRPAGWDLDLQHLQDPDTGLVHLDLVKSVPNLAVADQRQVERSPMLRCLYESRILLECVAPGARSHTA